MITKGQKQTYLKLLKEQKAIFKKAMKKFRNIYLIYFIIGAATGFCLTFLGEILTKNGIIDIDNYYVYLLLGFILFIISIVIQIIIHETGHLIFGLLSGYKFLSFRIFSLTLVKKDGRIQRKKYSIKGTAGQCLMYPPERNTDGSFPFILYNLGGGLANLIISIAVLVLAIFADNVILSTICYAFSISGIALGLTNIIPMDLGIQNDGMNLKGMLKYKYLQDSFYLQLKVNAEMSEGKLITEYNYEEFKLPEDADVKYTLTAFNEFYTYYKLLAEHDFESAYNYLMKMDEKSDKYPLATLNMLQAEKLFFMVLHHRTVEEIAAVYKRVSMLLKTAKTNINLQRIYYIYEALLSEEEKQDIMTLIMGKEQKKRKACDLNKLRQELEQTAKNYPVIGEAVMHMDIVDYCCQQKDVNYSEKAQNS